MQLVLLIKQFVNRYKVLMFLQLVCCHI